MTRNNCIIVFFLLFVLLFLDITFGQIERFIPKQGGTTELWRITNEPTVRDWANYHNTDAWSPDGRYLCFTHYASDEHEFGTSAAAEIHIFDIHEEKEIKVDNGTHPRWANNHNWLIYVHHRPEDGPPTGKGTQVKWLDADSKKLTRIAYGLPALGETDCGDRWIYGYKEFGGVRRQGFRIPIRPYSRVEILEDMAGIQWFPNPKYPVVFARSDNRDFMFRPTRKWCNLEGKNITIGSPTLQQCHQSWSGDGMYYLHGNSQMRGRKWNEPFPSNLNYLASVSCGDISACGKSGRWICGSGSYGSSPVGDLRSGDGWTYMTFLSIICYPGSFDASGPYDGDAKGSPDGTKIVFVSNYDLKDGPLTEIVKDFSESDDRLVVQSTAGFPESGRLVSVGGFNREVLSYARKTPTSFEDLSRALYGTPLSNPRKGQILTSFEARCIPEEQWKKLPLQAGYLRESISDADSPLLRQRSTDVYVAIVRKPDKPYLWGVDKEVELIPGENHMETFGYIIFRNGERITPNPLRPGTTFSLAEPGMYTAAAVEWSGLKSGQSFPLQINNAVTLKIRQNKPADFSWTYDRWLIDGKEVDVRNAEKSADAVREIVHLYDGVIHREWYNWGEIKKRYDLNFNGKPIRRLFYRDGKLERREYHNREGVHLSTEIFDVNGYITESVQYQKINGDYKELNHWWFESGMPVKYSAKTTHRRL